MFYLADGTVPRSIPVWSVPLPMRPVSGRVGSGDGQGSGGAEGQMSMTRCFTGPLTVGLLCALCLGGCAAGGAADIPPASGIATGSTARATPPVLDEKLDCRRINGRMQVHILQIRDRLGEAPGLYDALGDLLGPLMASGATERVDPASAEDVAQLKAYNALLAKKGCPTFDLSAELKPHPVTHTPRPAAKP